MQRVRINEGRVGLVFRSGNYQRVILPGIYWLFPFEKVQVYDLSKPFYPPVAVELLLKDARLADMLTVIEVKDNELVIQFEHGVFKNVLTAGKYFYWKGLIDFSFIQVNLAGNGQVIDQLRSIFAPVK